MEMDVWMDGWTNGWMDGWMDGWLGICANGQLDRQVGRQRIYNGKTDHIKSFKIDRI